MRMSLQYLNYPKRQEKKPVISIIHAIERLSIWIGRSFGWCILILTLSVAYEVFVRYVLNAPTVWVFDLSLIHI